MLLGQLCFVLFHERSCCLGLMAVKFSFAGIGSLPGCFPRGGVRGGVSMKFATLLFICQVGTHKNMIQPGVKGVQVVLHHKVTRFQLAINAQLVAVGYLLGHPADGQQRQ